MDEDYGSDDRPDYESSLQDIESAVHRVEIAIKDRDSPLHWIWVLFLLYIVFGWVGNAWHSKWRYALQYSMDASQITVDDKPHVCNFFAAPIGEKYCHYDPIISTLK